MRTLCFYQFDDVVVRHSIIGKLWLDAVSYRDLDATTALLGRRQPRSRGVSIVFDRGDPMILQPWPPWAGGVGHNRQQME